MNAIQRLLVVIGLVVVAAVGFVVAKAADDSGEDFPPDTVAVDAAPATAPEPGEGTAVPTEPGTAATTPAPRRPAAPRIPRIVVRGLEPVGGVQRLELRKGQTIRFQVVSDAPEEVHLHGYDVARDVAPGRPATFAVPARIEGIFEAELEQAGVQIASVVVEP